MTAPFKIGLIGTGSISRLHLLAFRRYPEKVDLTAVCDIDEDAARERAGEAGVDAVYTDAAQMLRDADIDAVDICTTHSTHAPIAIAAAEAGKHVLLEKPMANTLAECRDIIAATEKAGVTFMVAQQLRHVPSYVAVRRLIEEGELGRIWGARSDSWLPVIMSRSALPDRFQGMTKHQWRLDGKQAGGGSLIWNATHFIDLLRYFIGDVKRVFGKCWTDHPLFAGGAEDRAMATLEFENGAIGHLSNSWTTRAPWRFEVMVFGEDGTVYTPPIEGNPVEQHEAPAVVSSPKRDKEGMGPAERFSTFVPVEPATEGVAGDNAYANEIIHFAECCRQGKEPVSSGRDNLGTMKTLIGIYESSRTGEMVELAKL